MTFEGRAAMRANPIISVLMPAYNAGPKIGQAIESILGQTFKNWELVLVDDGSSDDTLQKATLVDDPRIRIFSRPHLGIVDALNFGVSQCRGRWIARADADDINHPRRLTEQFKAITPQLVLGTSMLAFSDGGGERLWRYPEGHDEIAAAMPVSNPMAHPTVMLSAHWLKQNPYPDGYDGQEDWALWKILMAKGARFGNLQQALVRYRLKRPAAD